MKTCAYVSVSFHIIQPEMKKYVRLLLLLNGTLVARAQQPTIDPNFVPTRCYAPAAVRQAVQQPDGKLVVIGDWTRAEGVAAGPVVRYLAGGTQPDAVFNANCRNITSAGERAKIEQVVPLANGKLLLVNQSSLPLTLGGITRQMMARLNADGTPDAGFDAGAVLVPYSQVKVHKLMEQPDGKLLLAGSFVRSGGLPGQALLRLNPDGSLDTAFAAALGNLLVDKVIDLALQPDGRILASCTGTVAGGNRHTLVRLLASGAYDNSFDDRAGRATIAGNLALQPDGKVLAALFTTSGAVADSLGGQPAQRLVRLDAAGTRDASFQLDAQVPFSAALPTPGHATPMVMQVQPDGRVLLAGAYRLLASGARDASFAPDIALAASQAWTATERYATTVQLLPSGKLLVAGLQKHYAGPGSPAQGLALLNMDGTRDPGFAPNLQTTGQLNAVLRQADGKFLIGGFFDEMNGQRINNIARLNADGSMDAAYAPATVDDEVTALGLQADGKLVVGGRFRQVGSSGRPGLARLLPAGGLDAAFAPALTATAAASLPIIGRVLILPTGQLLVAGQFSAGAGYRHLVRFDGATGQVDAGFQLPASLAAATGAAADALLLPGGNVAAILSPNNPADPAQVVRLLPSGAPDPTFAYAPVASGLIRKAPSCLATDAAGRLYLSGINYDAESGQGFLAERLLPDGSRDASFFSRYSGGWGPTDIFMARVNKLLVQPNGRLLLGGSFALPIVSNAGMPQGRGGTCRVLDTGALDTTYDPTRGPGQDVADMLLEPDGAIVVAGSFTESFSGQTYHGLMRLRDANVLSAGAPQLRAATAAWPVPAHGQLHLTLAAEAHPRQVQLLDALGRVVLSQVVTGAELTLHTAALPAGAYVVRVDYAAGPVSCRVVLE